MNQLFQANASLLMRHRRDSIWVFHPELMKICATSYACPLRVEPGKPGPVGIFRIERHVFRVAVTPVEKKVAYRVIASKNAILRGSSTFGSPDNGLAGRNNDSDHRPNRRGYRGRSSRPMSEILADISSVREAQQVFRQVSAAAAVDPVVDNNADEQVSVDNDVLDLFADENLEDVSMPDAAGEPNADAELEGLLAEAAGRNVCILDFRP